MTLTPDKAMYPTGWEVHNDEGFVDNPGLVEWRQLTDDTFQLRSPTHTMILDSEGFRLFKEQNLQGHVLFQDYCYRHGIKSEPRKVDNG